MKQKLFLFLLALFLGAGPLSAQGLLEIKGDYAYRQSHTQSSEGQEQDQIVSDRMAGLDVYYYAFGQLGWEDHYNRLEVGELLTEDTWTRQRGRLGLPLWLLFARFDRQNLTNLWRFEQMPDKLVTALRQDDEVKTLGLILPQVGVLGRFVEELEEERSFYVQRFLGSPVEDGFLVRLKMTGWFAGRRPENEEGFFLGLDYYATDGVTLEDASTSMSLNQAQAYRSLVLLGYGFGSEQKLELAQENSNQEMDLERASDLAGFSNQQEEQATQVNLVLLSAQDFMIRLSRRWSQRSHQDQTPWSKTQVTRKRQRSSLGFQLAPPLALTLFSEEDRRQTQVTYLETSTQEEVQTSERVIGVKAEIRVKF